MSFSEKFQSGCLYHLWTHGVLKENLFIEEENYNYFLKRYFSKTLSILKTHAYCLLPNHVHFLVTVRNEDEILDRLQKRDVITIKKKDLSYFVSKTMGGFLNSYAKSFNSRYKRKGPLFERGFKRKLIDSEEYFTKIVLYIHSNPIHHGYVNQLKDWTFSSWNSYIKTDEDQLYKNEVIDWFGGIEIFKSMHLDLER